MVEETAAGERAGMAPWEQHSAVISLPRFDYKAPSSLLEHSHSGFLITCTIKREKSATKEAISILEKYIGSFSCGDSKRSDSPDAILATKKRKTCHEEENGEDIKREYCKEAGISGASGEIREGTTVSSTDADVDAESGGSLSLVKLTRSGLLLFTFPRNGCLDTINILSNIFESLNSGGLKPPLWCHRILPIQATCCLKEKDLQVTVSRLVRQYLDDERNKVERPIRFAVGYNRRGIDEKAEMKTKKNTSCDSKESSLLDRNQCFSIVAGAFHEVAADSVVDLKSPELAVLVELLPISGVPIGSSVVAISVLPCNLFTTKPRLCVKALAADAKTAKGRS
ncbi:hypothetical protein CKAN_01960400 [Cinnamomum micranthum f. kanehirae]|uniref:Uncharacterized protein n=1 Tax=Cinnamomum micranthum f. kanehirae TaxID=337451 RepID=A0A3S3MVB2_9MAGN|nr:hypothetical protein CKAN_01960400 [Cinnamomum micranthum f. kanehirae]